MALIAHLLHHLSHRSRLRGEILWVVGHKLIEFVVAYAVLKILTTMLGTEQFGEYSLVLTGLMLLTAVFYAPVGYPFVRHFHTASAAGTLRHAARVVLRWQLATTIAIAIGAAAISVPLGELLGLHPLTLMAAGAVYLTDRWRGFAVELYDVQRDRRTAAILNLGSLVLRLVLMGLLIALFGPVALFALLGYMIASGLFAMIGNLPQLQKLLHGPQRSDAALGPLIWTFGLPYALVLVFQWIQGFSDRYIVVWHLDLASAGMYAAAFQVTGIPFMLLHSIVQTLIVPVAYQRATDLGNPTQVAAANRVLLAGTAVYLLAGLVALPIYALAGAWLMRLLTSEEFVLPVVMIVTLAAARWVQNFGLLLQTFFAVHHAMMRSLALRCLGAVITVPICWFATGRWGMMGAAGGVLVASLLYVALTIFAPGGCLSLVRRGPGSSQGAAVDRPAPEPPM